MKTALVIAFAIFAPATVLAHGYRVGDLEIIHPAIMVPSLRSDCSCAHVKIVNHGSRPEYLLGAGMSAIAGAIAV